MSHLIPQDLPDPDPSETNDWLESIDVVRKRLGLDRARFLLQALLKRASGEGFLPDGPLITDYINSIPALEEPKYPGDLALEERILDIIRWNAAAMVHRANVNFSGIGGHLSSYASAATLYEVGFQHFFRGKDAKGGGDQIYYQGHISPGLYARSYLEGRMDEARLDHFRREGKRGKGLSSYPHPRLMPEYWEFPTVSMGLGPICAIYQARFNRYLHMRGLVDTSECRVWAFLGDGECDEPESLGAISVAAREHLDNLTFVINCNLQRLDGPVRGNGQIVQELEASFRGAGWNVIKVLWSSEWDPLFARDEQGKLRAMLTRTVDGQFQKYSAANGSVIRNEWFAKDPDVLKLVSPLSDQQIEQLRRGGHDFRKVYAGYKAAVETRHRPSVLLVQTVKGWGLGEGFEAKNITHSMKKFALDQLKDYRDRLDLPIPDDKIDEAPYYRPGPDSPEVRYLKERRAALGGPLPERRNRVTVPVKLPEFEFYEEFIKGSKTRDGVSTTMAFVRLLTKLLQDKDLGPHIVPIIPDEARTFGMDPLFRLVGIWAHKGQLYEPIDKGLLLYYREAENGQVLEEGITEAGATASLMAAGTSYSTHGLPMVPFYIFYSMFGFQRVGDLMWQFSDMRGRGFFMGATAGRTTLNGEGLQHEDGHSHVLANVFPNIKAYDPAFAYETSLIVRDGLRRMVKENEDIYYYITLQNENYPMPKMQHGIEDDLLRGLYCYRPTTKQQKLHVQLFGSGCILLEVLEAQKILAQDYAVSSDVWSATSYQQLRDDALRCERWNRLHPESRPRVPFLSSKLAGTKGPYIATTDYMKLVPDMVSRWIPGTFVSLGTDGFGMSDTREQLRRHFEIGRRFIVIASLDALRSEGRVEASLVSKAIRDLGLDADKIDPLDI